MSPAYIDAILYIANLDSLTDYVASASPERILGSEVMDFIGMPSVRNGVKVLVYIRVSQESFNFWQSCEHVVVLGSVPYAVDCSEQLYTRIFEDPEKLVMYHDVFPAVVTASSDGSLVRSNPRFGAVL